MYNDIIVEVAMGFLPYLYFDNKPVNMRFCTVELRTVAKVLEAWKPRLIGRKRLMRQTMLEQGNVLR